MRAFLLLSFIFCTPVFSSASSGGSDPDSLRPQASISKTTLTRLIDSILDLERVSARDLELLNALAFSQADCSPCPDPLLLHPGVAKIKLTHLIDSILELDRVGPADVTLLNTYATLLKNSRQKQEFNLNELSFYSASDEKILFPLGKLDSLPPNFTMELENDYLGYYMTPCKGVVTSNYGWREGRIHKGIDIDLNKGDHVYAAFDGKVRLARAQGGFGNVVILMHPNGLETVYAHLSRFKVKEGDIVLSGQTIGLGGNTGHSSGSHLHFEVHYLGHALNPGTIISFTEHKLYHHSVTIKNSKQSLCAFPANSNLHRVNRGESWYQIASKYGLSLKELMALNGVGRRYYLKEGQQLRIN